MGPPPKSSIKITLYGKENDSEEQAESTHKAWTFLCFFNRDVLFFPTHKEAKRQKEIDNEKREK